MAVQAPPAEAARKALADIETARALLRGASEHIRTERLTNDEATIRARIEKLCDRIAGLLLLHNPGARRTVLPDRVLP